ncbi:flagellar brake protein [Ampullimonas aquatilis]|uniref:flagellar brake protein n=1 Tax=Ampullimonas aquatilis TaxID=1341549 RepID=UPI003C70F727
MMNMLEAARPENNPSDLQQYQVESRVEIIAILKKVIKARAFVTIYFNMGNDFIVTQLLHIDEKNGHLYFDCGADERANRQLLAANRLAVVTFLDAIKIQFHGSIAEQIAFEGRPALRKALPTSLLRLQRRDFYRVPTSKAKPVVCRASMPAEKQAIIDLRIVDISCGGIGVMLTHPGIQLSVGDMLHRGRIVLPEFGEIISALEVRYIESGDGIATSGSNSPHIGCRFVDLPGPMLSLLQRYINKVDRDRRALIDG